MLLGVRPGFSSLRSHSLGLPSGFTARGQPVQKEIESAKLVVDGPRQTIGLFGKPANFKWRRFGRYLPARLKETVP